MKTLKFFLFFLFTTLTTSAFSTGVIFETGTWADAVAKAKKENKPIFIDAYTDWCGWCKVMDKETFPDEKIGAFFGEKLVAYKMNMEVGDGIKMAMKYRVQAFPSYLIFSPDGKLLYKTAGYQKADDFMKTLTASLEKTNQMTYPSTFDNLDVTFPEFYKNAFAGNGKRKFPKNEEVVAYLDSQKDLFSEVNWSVMFAFETNDKYNNYFFENLEKYKTLYGTTEINDKVTGIIYKKVKSAAEKKDRTALDAALVMIDKYVADDKEKQKQFWEMNYYQQSKQWNEYAGVAIKYVDKFAGDDSNTLNQFAWDFYENVSDKALLAYAESWAKKSISIKEQYANSDTYACILYKLGKKDEAMKAAEHAIELGKKEGVKTKDTESLLEMIKVMK